ncbi:MAG: peptide MFS transporter [Flavobacteriales bacterium]|nr:peptide MFS transporter [Flavobacteriales bacterium]MEB2341422.1 peptide MFS transporter [Flavobacteriia bacterium]
MSTSKTGHPRGLYLLFVTEMWERFSYYGMRAIFMLFMVKALLISDAEASNVYGSYTGLVYLTPLLGGYISDRFWGNRRSILVGGLLMALGQLLLFISGSFVETGAQNANAMTAMWAGLTLLIIGNGFFKPNISTMVGQLYPANDRRIDSAFTIFYMGINLGALFSPLVAGTLGDTGNIFDFKWGFLAASIGMMLSILTFELLKNKYLVHDDGTPVGMPKAKMDMKTILSILGSVAVIFFLMNFKSWFQTDFDLTGVLIYGAMVAMPIVIFSDKSLVHEEKQRISVIFILAFFVIFFWACFEQAGASLTLFADRQTDRHIGSWEMPASYFQSVNPIFIITLAPLFSMLWGWLGKKGWEPSSPLKMAMGLGLLALGYAVIAFGVHGMAPSAKISLWWLITLYGLHTMGELCLSPIGLSMVSKLAPIRLSSLLMGTWFLANAAANKFAGTLSALIPPSAEDLAKDASLKIPTFLGFQLDNLFSFFLVFIALSGSAAVVLVVIHKWLQKRMHGIN